MTSRNDGCNLLRLDDADDLKDAPEAFLQDYLPFLMVRAHSLMTAKLNLVIQQQGFTTAEWRILATVYDSAQAKGLTITRLAETTDLTQPTVSRWVAKLQRKGLITRGETSDDLRHSLISLSPAGEDAAKELLSIADAHQSQAFSIFSSTDVQKLMRMLRELVAGLEEEAQRKDRLGRRRLL